MSTSINLMEVYETLIAAFGPQRWWPAESPEEMIIGALLTQNTNWHNVERALDNLREKKLLSFPEILDTPLSLLEDEIKPSGYFRQKSKRLQGLAQAIVAAGGLSELNKSETPALRKWLLNLKGIGPETADSILLYAFNRAIFVVDTYTKRVCKRHLWLPEDADYPETQKFFSENLPANVTVFNEFHALLVQIGKNFCRKQNPVCHNCPLKQLLSISN